MSVSDVIKQTLQSPELRFNYSHGQLSEILSLQAEFNIRTSHHAKSPINRRLETLREFTRWVSEQRSPNAVFMDTTTLYTAWNLIKDESPCLLTANTLLDLDTFIRAVVLYDQIFHLPNDYVNAEALNEALGNEPIVIPLPVEKSENGWLSDTEAELCEIVDQASSDISSMFREDMEALLSSWEIILGHPVSGAEVMAAHPTNRHWASNGPALVNSLLDSLYADEDGFMQMGMSDWTPAVFVNECALRCVISMHVSDILDLSYAPNHARIPFLRHLLGNAIATVDAFQDVDELQAVITEQNRSYVRPYTVQLPIFLTAVLARSNGLNTFFSEVANIRLEAAPYRARRRDLVEAIASGDHREIERIRQAIQADSKSLIEAIKAPIGLTLIGVLTPISLALVGILIASLKLLNIGKELSPEARQALIRRVSRPDEWFLTDLGTTARRLTNALPQIKRYWSIQDEQANLIAGRLRQLEAVDWLKKDW